MINKKYILQIFRTPHLWLSKDLMNPCDPFWEQKILVTSICCVCELIRQNTQWSLNFWLLSTLPSIIFIPLFSDLGLENSGRTWQNFRFWEVFRAKKHFHIVYICLGFSALLTEENEKFVTILEAPGSDPYTWLKSRKLFYIFLFGSWTPTDFAASHFAEVFFACCQESQKQLTPDITMLIDLIH